MTRTGSLATGIVLARLLTPADFGVFAVALVVFSLLVNVSELGVSVALVRTPGDVSRLVPTVTTISLVSGGLLALLCWVTAPWCASALQVPGAVPVLRLLAVAVAVAGAAAVPGALLQREFRQDVKMAADGASLVVSTAVTVLLALHGSGAEALGWGRLAGAAVALAVLVARWPGRRRPGFDRTQVRELLATGLPLAGASLLVFGVLNVDYVVVGRALGPELLGLYVLAFNLSSWPVNALSAAVRGVALPALARRPAGAERSEDVVRGLRWLSTATLPVCVLLAVLSGDIVQVVYGSRWAAAATPLVLLAGLGAGRVAFELVYGLLVAEGRGRTVLLLHAAWLLALVPALTLGARLDGLRGVGAAHLVVLLVVVAPLQARALGALGVRWTAVRAVLARPVAAALACAVVALAVRQVDGPRPLVLVLAAAAGTAAHLLVSRPLLLQLRDDHRERRARPAPTGLDLAAT